MLKIASMQNSVHRLEDELKVQIQYQMNLEETHANKLKIVKADYDLLYDKYLKYKKIAANLQLRLQTGEY